MKFIQHRGSGQVYHWTKELEDRDDVDVIEAPAGMTPDQVKQSLDDARDKLRVEAELAAAEAERAAGVKLVAARTRKVTTVEVPKGAVVVKGGAQQSQPPVDGGKDGAGEGGGDGNDD